MATLETYLRNELDQDRRTNHKLTLIPSFDGKVHISVQPDMYHPIIRADFSVEGNVLTGLSLADEPAEKPAGKRKPKTDAAT